MKTVMTTRAIAGLVATLLICATASVQAADIEAGRAVYQNNCAMCHGAGGSPEYATVAIEPSEPRPVGWVQGQLHDRRPDG